MLRVLIVSLMVLFTAVAGAQEDEPGRGGGSLISGLRPYAGIGYVNYHIKSAAGNVEMDRGIFAYIGAESAINESGLSLTLALNYMNSDGTATYDYSTGGDRYLGNQIDFDMNTYQFNLGLRQRFLRGEFFRPYVEGGGIASYHSVGYRGGSSIAHVTGAGSATGFKTSDSVTGFGFYGEVGAEIDFATNIGTRVGARFQRTETEKLQTLANQKITLESMIFQFALLLRF